MLNAKRSVVGVKTLFSAFPLYLAIGLIALLCTQGLSYALYLETHRDAHREMQGAGAMIMTYIESEFERAVVENHALADYIQQTGDTQRGLLDQMNQRVDRQHGSWLRFGWSDAEGKLRSGSVAGVFKEPYDLNHRDYIKAAKREPGVMHYDVVQHIFQHRPYMIFAQGIANPTQGYIGTIASLFDVGSMMQTVRGYVDEVHYRMRMVERKGQALIDAGPFAPDYTRQDVGGFVTLEMALQPAYHAVLRKQYGALAFASLLLSMALGLLAKLLQRGVMQHMMRVVQETLGAERNSPVSSDVAVTTGHIRDLLQTHLNSRDEVLHYKQQLAEALQLIRGFQHEQNDFFSSLNTEIEAVVDALESYGELVEGQGDTVNRLRDYMPDLAVRLHTAQSEPFIQLQEVQNNMRFLSQALHSMCQHVTTQTLPDMGDKIDAASLLKGLLEEYCEQMESHYMGPAQLEICCNEEMIYTTLQALLLLTQRHSSAVTHFTLKADEGGVEIAAAFCAEDSPPQQVNASGFEAFAVPKQLTHILRQDVAYFVLRYFARVLQGEAWVQMHDEICKVTLRVPSAKSD